MTTIPGLAKAYYDTWRSMSIFHRIINEPNRSYSLNIRAILVLYNQKKCTLNKLAKTLGLKASACSNRVNQLVTQGLVDRVANDSDRREILVTLTPQGTKMAENEMDRRYEAMNTAFSQLTQEEQKSLLQSCTTMQEALARIFLDMDI
ncbi:MarR family winged helix-turn-helix transcriptional regulator [Breznakiella homolactica]|uniref:Winged helix-turn-helix transcriptional regulator n=1 Tax=Breznakiella homolactica TaxID=2798577 RepID=A0A7T7XMJ8_9SPIR|nr:MarR family winged helix-turn-helix transcriptional regulator [Breznakiella homolactica]QQO09100.1 MarR family winged helix-turn-helix transcriptional regulator [Breznakiella homolactica]